MAETLGEHTFRYRWSGAFYTLLVFVLIPPALFAFSFAIALGPGGIVLDVILDMLTIGGTIMIARKFDKVTVLLGKGEEAGPATGPSRTEGTTLTDARSPGKSETTPDAGKMQV